MHHSYEGRERLGPASRPIEGNAPFTEAEHGMHSWRPNLPDQVFDGTDWTASCISPPPRCLTGQRLAERSPRRRGCAWPESASCGERGHRWGSFGVRAAGVLVRSVWDSVLLCPRHPPHSRVVIPSPLSSDPPSPPLDLPLRLVSHALTIMYGWRSLYTTTSRGTGVEPGCGSVQLGGEACHRMV